MDMSLHVGFIKVSMSQVILRIYVQVSHAHILGVEINVPVADVDFKCVDEPLKLGIGSPYFGKGYSKCKKKF